MLSLKQTNQIKCLLLFNESINQKHEDTGFNQIFYYNGGVGEDETKHFQYLVNNYS